MRWLTDQVHSRQRHGDRLKEYLLEAMGSASKSIDDDTEALAMLTTLLQYAAVLRFFHDCFFHTILLAHLGHSWRISILPCHRLKH